MATVRPPPGNGDDTANPRPDPSPTADQRYIGARNSATAVVAAIVALGYFALGISPAALLPAMAMGLLLGAMKQLPALRRLSDHPVFTAFLGAEWRRYRPHETLIDISAALVVGYAVGLAVSWSTAGSVDTAWFVTVMSGGGSGGDGVGMLMSWILYLLLCALVGFLVTLLTERVVLEAAIAAGNVSWPLAAEKAVGSIVEEHVTATVTGSQPALIEPLIKGALHGALVGVALALIERASRG